MRLTPIVSSIIVCCTLILMPPSVAQPTETIGASLVDTLNGHDAQAVVASFDTQQLTRRIGVASLDETKVRQLVAATFQNLLGQGQSIKLLQTRARGNQTLVLTRLDSQDPGLDYLEFLCEPRSSGGYQVIDWYSLRFGDLFGAMIATPYKLQAGDPETLRALFGTTPIDTDTKAKLALWGAQINAGEDKEARATLEQLPTAIVESRYLLLQALRLASKDNDRTAAGLVAGRLAEKYSTDPAVALRLLNYYIAQRQTEALFRAAAILEQRVGPDIVSNLARAEALWNGQARDQSMWYTQQAVRVEPDSRLAWARLAARYARLEDYATAVSVYRSMETKFGMKFDRAYFESGDKCWEGGEEGNNCVDFLRSDAFNQWLPLDAPAAGKHAEPAQPPPPTPASVANSLVQAINDCSTDTVYNLVDTGDLAVRIEKLAHTPYIITRQSKYIVVGNILLAKCESKLGPVAVKLMRVGDLDGEKRALVRYYWTQSGGSDYVEFVLEPDLLGRIHVVDWYTLTLGQTESEFLSEIQRLVQLSGPTSTPAGEAYLAALGRIVQFQKEGHYAEAIGAMSDVPTEVATSRSILLWRARLAVLGKNQSQYEWTLSALADKYGTDPSLMFKMMEYYEQHQQYDKALDRLAAMEQRVGADGVTNLMKEKIERESGAYAQALTFASRAMELEPELPLVWYAVARDNVGLKNYAQAVAGFQRMQTRFGSHYTRDQFTQDPEMAAFVQSAEFRKWLPQ